MCGVFVLIIAICVIKIYQYNKSIKTSIEEIKKQHDELYKASKEVLRLRELKHQRMLNQEQHAVPRNQEEN